MCLSHGQWRVRRCFALQDTQPLIDLLPKEVVNLRIDPPPAKAFCQLLQPRGSRSDGMNAAWFTAAYSRPNQEMVPGFERVQVR
jgi:hypothetical protein